MKRGILRILMVAFVLTLLIVGITAAPALAAPAINLEPNEGERGDEIRLAGDGFNINTTVYIYFSSDAADVGDYIDDEVNTYERVKIMYTNGGGELYNYFDVPSRLNDGTDDKYVHGGSYYVYATYASNKYIRATADFTVILGGITLDPNEGTVDTEVKITGTDFNTIEDITVRYDGINMAIDRGDDETDIDGGFTSYILIPSSPAGEHTIKVIDESGSEAEATFTVKPDISISPTSGDVGTRVTAQGTGFIKSGQLSIYFGIQEVVGDGKTGSDGGFVITFNVPASGPGEYVVEARDDDDNSDGAQFTVTSSVSISPATTETSPGHVGTELTISGSGFLIAGTVNIKYDTTQVATTSTDANGVFTATFAIPESQSGEHTIIVTDGINTKDFTFIMESTAPQIPQPLKPEIGAKAESEVYFDWQDVTDPSGITYNLQISSEKEFTSIVLEKTNLTDSEYTLTKAEKMKLINKDEPYYWRVKAVDGASNDSGWSGVGSFYVGFPSGFPQWAIYALIGVGALILGVVGFWAGRKTASPKTL